MNIFWILIQLSPVGEHFFKGFEFGIDKKSKNEDFLIPENILKEFRVVELINAYTKQEGTFLQKQIQSEIEESMYQHWI